MSGPALTLPAFSVVALVGASGAGKSSFARQHFKGTEVLSSDSFRGLVSDDETALDATQDAFDALYYVARKRLANRRLTVIDATNTQKAARRSIVALAREYHCLAAAIVLNIDPAICQARNRERPDRNFGSHVVRNQSFALRKSLRSLKREGFRYIHVLSSPEEAAAVTIERQRLWTDRRDEHGPFDIIGDVHGCYVELRALLDKLGWQVTAKKTSAGQRYDLAHPEGRTLVFLGDLVDRGPNVPGVLRLVMDAVDSGQALCVPGNHDIKLLRALRGRQVKVAYGLAESLAQLEQESEAFRARVAAFIDGLISHFELDDGRLVVAHAGMRQDMQGRASGAVRTFALYGETTGETDEFGLPVRYNWAQDYRGRSTVVYGHTPVLEPEWLNRTINIDTGCVFGGRLSALRYPEKEIVSVPARAVYSEPVRPLAPPQEDDRAAQQLHDDLLHLEDVQGKRSISTRLRGHLTISEENATAALEVMSRFAADPRWLIYLPPTMAPSETSQREGLLEHPDEAFAYYGRIGVERVVCEAKHMGSRAVVIICRDEDAARARFGIDTGEIGICYTRTGRRFFSDAAIERQLLERVRTAATSAGLWDALETSWLCFDCELMPWSVKAQELLRNQYALVGAAALASLEHTAALLAANKNEAIDLTAMHEDILQRRDRVARYRDAYRHYCWPVESVDDLKLAPFHLLASEGTVHSERDHRWHLEQAKRLAAAADGVLIATENHAVELADDASRAQATQWWTDFTARGGEGMVIKPACFLTRGRRGLSQPALKCRGREYLRIIYGPEYTDPRHLTRLRKRNLSRKRSLALRELALGLEALERFVAREPLRRVHECVFGVLALESEPVDPRL